MGLNTLRPTRVLPLFRMGHAIENDDTFGQYLIDGKPKWVYKSVLHRVDNIIK
jgi:hypothetical protein